jgi:galactitol-specific phosphotransferase system IIC component
MLNQTTGIWHMEAVSPNCKTIGEALNERFGGKNFKIIGIS